MAAHWLWWIMAAVLVGAELLTGTYYLLGVGVALAFGGVAAYAGADMAIQFVVAGGLGVVLTIAAHRWRLRHALPPAPAALDIGQPVRVRAWRDDGTLRVSYRGTEWDAELATPGIDRTDTLFIVAMRGSVLMVSNRRPVA